MVPEPPWSSKSDRTERIAITVVFKVIAFLVVCLIVVAAYLVTRGKFPAWLDYLVVIIPLVTFLFLFDPTRPGIDSPFWVRWFGVFPLGLLVIAMAASAIFITPDLSIMAAGIGSVIWFVIFRRPN